MTVFIIVVVPAFMVNTAVLTVFNKLIEEVPIVIFLFPRPELVMPPPETA